MLSAGNSESPGTVIAPTVLLVEDNEALRWSTSELIQDLGYQVVEAYSAEEAMTVLLHRAVDVLVTDLGLPGLSGEVFAAEARVMCPELPIIFVTGNDRFLGIRDDGTSSVVIRKPYDGDDLARAFARLRAAVAGIGVRSEAAGDSEAPQ